MKRLNTLIATVLLIIGSCGLAHAQTIDAGANIGGALPIGDLGDTHNPGLSWNVFGIYHVTNQVSAGIEIGGSAFNFDGPDFGPYSLDISLSELLLVGNYVFYESDGVRIGGGLGAGIFSNDNNSNFGISPRVIAHYMVTENIGFNAQVPVNIVFNSNGNLNYFALRIGGFYRIDL